jgi:hypothetical protein
VIWARKVETMLIYPTIGVEWRDRRAHCPSGHHPPRSHTKTRSAFLLSSISLHVTVEFLTSQRASGGAQGREEGETIRQVSQVQTTQ